MYTVSFWRKKFSTLTTEGWEICASERPSSKKLLRPRRYSDSFSGATCGTSAPASRMVSAEGRYSLTATCWPSLSTAR